MHIICVEGLDGVGKESISYQLQAVIATHGFSVERISFPNYCSYPGTVIKNLLDGQYGDASKLPSQLVAPLYTLDRISYFKDNLECLRKLDFIILDRSFYSNFIYQASKLWNSMESDDACREKLVETLVDWCRVNYRLELKETGLLDAADSITVLYLQLPEEDRQKQLQNRENLDTNESNLAYLDSCRQFMDPANIDQIKLDARKYLGGDESFMQAYVGDLLYRVNVNHAKRYSDIDEENYATAKEIFIKLIDDNYSMNDVRFIEYRSEIRMNKIQERLNAVLNLDNPDAIKASLQLHIRQTSNGLEIILLTVIDNCEMPWEAKNIVETAMSNILKSELGNLEAALSSKYKVIFKAIAI